MDTLHDLEAVPRIRGAIEMLRYGCDGKISLDEAIPAAIKLIRTAERWEMKHKKAVALSSPPSSDVA